MTRTPAVVCRAVPALLAVLTLAACAAPGSSPPTSSSPPGVPAASFADVEAQAQGQTVSLWMYGGDEQGNAYVDDDLIPAAAAAGVTLRRVPVADTGEAITRILSERQAGSTDGDVDLVWVNGNNFGTAKQAGGWLCDWAGTLPNRKYVDPTDPLLVSDFGTPIDGCESPWHKAQFTLVYDSAKVADPPTTLQGVLDYAKAHPGRFTYPAPPDFTGSVFLREVAVSQGDVPVDYTPEAAGQVTPGLYAALEELAPSLWREGATYPKDQTELDRLYAGGEIDFTMTYGPATLTDLVAKGTFPSTTTVLTLTDGTVGNASFLAIPSTSGSQAGAKVVANLALSPEQQLKKAEPDVWGQFTVLDTALLDSTDAAAFAALPSSPVVPSYETLSKNAHAELGSAWVPVLDEGWRRQVLAGS